MQAEPQRWLKASALVAWRLALTLLLAPAAVAQTQPCATAVELYHLGTAIGNNQTLALLRPLASTQKEPCAQYMMGLLYEQGLGITKDITRAVAWYKLAVAQGYAAAQSTLGHYYGEDGDDQNIALALQLERKAAAQGHMFGLNNLGVYYDYGLGVPVNKPTALSYYLKAARQGSATAQRNAALQYSQGKGGVARNDKLALFWMQLSANQDGTTGDNSRAALPGYKAPCTGSCNTQAMQLVNSFRVQDACTASDLTRVNFCNSHGSPTVVDDAVQKVCICLCDPTSKYNSANCDHQQPCGQAYRLYLKATAASDTEALSLLQPLASTQKEPCAQYMMGLLYRDGLGVTKDMTRAVAWYKLAVAQGYAEAQSALGHYYGEDGDDQNIALALQLERKAAAQGHMFGLNNLGVYYDYGLGVPVNKPTALSYYLKAARQGSATAQRNAALQYSQGKGGVARNDKLALFWMQLSANQDGTTGDNSRAALPGYKAPCTGSCNTQAMQLVNSFRVQDACTASDLTRVNFCNSHGSPTVVDDAVQKVCTCVPDPIATTVTTTITTETIFTTTTTTTTRTTTTTSTLTSTTTTTTITTTTTATSTLTSITMAEKTTTRARATSPTTATASAATIAPTTVLATAVTATTATRKRIAGKLPLTTTKARGVTMLSPDDTFADTATVTLPSSNGLHPSEANATGGTTAPSSGTGDSGNDTDTTVLVAVFTLVSLLVLVALVVCGVCFVKRHRKRRNLETRAYGSRHEPTTDSSHTYINEAFSEPGDDNTYGPTGGAKDLVEVTLTKPLGLSITGSAAEGVSVTKVEEGSSAQLSGVVKVGMYLHAINGESVVGASKDAVMAKMKAPGNEIKLGLGPKPEISGGRHTDHHHHNAVTG